MRTYLWVYFRGGSYRVSPLGVKPPYGVAPEAATRFGSNSFRGAVEEANRRNAALPDARAGAAKKKAARPDIPPLPAAQRRAVHSLHERFDPTRRDADRSRLELALSSPNTFWDEYWSRRRPWGNRASLARWMPAHALVDVLERRGRAVTLDVEGTVELFAALKPVAAKHGAAATRALSTAAREARQEPDADPVTTAATALSTAGLVLLTLATCSDASVFVILRADEVARARRAAAAAKITLTGAAPR